MIRRQLVVPASPERLWEALTDPETLRGWFGGDFEWELTEGAALHFRGDDGAERDGRIESVRQEKHLRFSWWPEGDAESASEVSYLIEPEGGGVRLTVQERPLEPPSESGATARARAAGSEHFSPDLPEVPEWTAWDTRLAGAWAGIGAEDRVGAASTPSLRASS